MQVAAPTAAAAPVPGSIVVKGANPNAGKSNLGADDFMKLLSAQLKAQDPMNPVKDTEFVAQMASFTSLEQMGTLVKSFNSFQADQRSASAPLYLGRDVTISDPNRGDLSGTVEAVLFDAGKPSVVINGEAYDLAYVTGVALAAGSAAAPAPKQPVQ
jgi:flagellar basal-body rod modification protein FlgD